MEIVFVLGIKQRVVLKANKSVIVIFSLCPDYCLLFKGAVSRYYHDFERFKNTPRSYITQQKMVLFWKASLNK